MNFDTTDTKLLNARLFAKKCLSNKLEDFNPNEYILLQISKFILLKERLIKKDNNENLYFNYNRNHEYYDVIKEIGDTLIKNAVILKIHKVLNVIIEPRKYNDNTTLKAYILLIHKLRDALAHGSYDIDFKKGNIIINSNTQDICMVTTIPIKLIEKFAYIVSPISIDEFNLLKNSNNHLLNEKQKLPLIYDKPKIIKDDYYPVDIYNNYYPESKKDQLEVLKALLIYAKNLGLSHKDIDYIFKSIKNEELFKQIKNNNIPIFNIKLLVDEMFKIMRIKDSNVNPYALVSLYNYMQIYLSNKYDELWNNRPPILSHLKLSKINPMFTKEPAIYKVIASLIKTIVNRTRKALNQYHSVNNTKYKAKILSDINKSFTNNINEILKLLNTRNMEVITGIRNSIEHGNIIDLDGKIVLFDKENQRDNNSISFVSMASIKDYYDIIETLDIGVLTPLTNQELLEELKVFVDQSLFNELQIIFNEIEELNNEIQL